jgi:hypothetical protein
MCNADMCIADMANADMQMQIMGAANAAEMRLSLTQPDWLFFFLVSISLRWH